MDYLLDIIVVIIVVFFAVMGYKKGVLKTVISVVGTLLASLMSSVLSKPIAEAIYNGGFKSSIIGKANSAMKLAQQEGKSFLDSFLESLPKFIQNSMPHFHVTNADLSSASQSGAAALERVIAPIVISFISIFVTIILFAVFMIVVKVVCAMIFSSMEDSALNFFDGILGGAIAIAEAFIIVLLAAFVLRIATPHMKKVPEFISDEAISNSTIFKGVYNSPILTGLVDAVTDSPNTEMVG